MQEYSQDYFEDFFVRYQNVNLRGTEQEVLAFRIVAKEFFMAGWSSAFEEHRKRLQEYYNSQMSRID